MEAENTYQVFDWLWTSGQLSEQDIHKLPELGIDVVLNLALPTLPNALSGEAELETRKGLAYVHNPVDWEAPKPEQFMQFIGILKAFEGSNIWVHCAKNMRASAFIYLYRKLVLAESDELASFPMSEIWTPNVTWKACIENMSDT